MVEAEGMANLWHITNRLHAGVLYVEVLKYVSLTLVAAA
jgi:hypothetical protein